MPARIISKPDPEDRFRDTCSCCRAVVEFAYGDLVLGYAGSLRVECPNCNGIIFFSVSTEACAPAESAN